MQSSICVEVAKKSHKLMIFKRKEADIYKMKTMYLD